MADACICAVCQNAGGNVLCRLFDGIFTFFSNPINLVRKCNNNVGNLKNKVAELKGEKETVDNYVVAVDRRGEHIAQRLTNWVTSANKCIEAADVLVSNAEESAEKKCFFGLCLNPKSRYQLSKKAEENSNAVAELVSEARGFNLPLSYNPAPQQEVAAPVKGFEDFNSRSDVLKEIMEALQITSINVVGVHGMPGVGKTMLIKEVKRKAEQDKLFDAVAMAYVTKEANLEKILTEIASGLRLDLPEKITTRDAADRIKARLRRMKRVLIILDDIWEKGIELNGIGICLKNEKMTNEGSSSKEEYAECKILLASRVSDVLLGMGAQEVFQVVPLQSDEPMKLFEKIVGESSPSCHEMQHIATEIVQECGGLPLAITTIAQGLQNKPPAVWRNALRKLKTPSSDNFNGICENIYRVIEISYSHLKSDKLRRTFLLCSLMGKNALIEDLLKYGVGLGLFANIIDEARDEALALMEELKDCSLIEGYDNRHCYMHGVVRDVAISIACRDRRGLLVTDYCVPKEWEDMKEMAHFEWIFLRYLNADGPADGPADELERPQLLFYLGGLAGKDYSLEILAKFLNQMHGLQVLYLTKMHFASLPSSIGLLKNLHTLCLDQSMLTDIQIIGKLVNLKILSLLNSDLEELPREIGCLPRLKLLDLRNCTKLKVILPSVLERMSKLEELYLGNSFDQWKDEKHKQHASLSELRNLNKLTALEIRIRDVQIIPEDLFSKKLKRCKIFVGDVWNNDWDSSFESSKIVKLQLKEASSFGCSVVKRLLEMAEELHLQDLNGVKNVANESNNESFQDLKYLFVCNASEVQQIINSSVEGILLNAFPNLKELILHNLINLEKIFQGQFKETAFNKLTVITIESCNRVKNLFSPSIARQLLQLQKITVTNCDKLKGIVDDDEQGSGNDIVELKPKFGELLRSLTLMHLPGLISFNSCRHMQLFNEQVGFLKLEEMQLSWINVITIWHISITPSCVEKLTKFFIEGCDKLEYLFSSSMAKGLVMLGHLEIRECKEMIKVIHTENDDEMGNLRFPKLNFLMIKDLHNITSFCSGNYVVEFTSLKQLQILNCPKMAAMREDVAAETQMLFNEQVDSPNLECLRLSSLNVQQIWHNPLPESSVQNLKRLFVEDCNNLKYLITSSIVKRFSQLIQLEIRDCKMMEEVILTKKLVEEERMCMIFFPKLDSIILQDLPKLTRFSSGSCLQLPSLWQLMISNCPMLKAFISNSILEDMAATSETEENSCTPLFNSKVAFPKLERLAIFMIGLNKIWHEQLNADSFCQLITVSVASCEKLMNIFPFSMLGMLQRLDKLEIWNCESLEEIFESQGLGVSQSLSQTTTQSTSMESTKRFVLSKLTHVDLRRLPKLKSFLPQMHIIEWPSLKKLWVHGCDQVQIIASQFSSIQITKGDDQHGIQTNYPLFWISKDSFPSLEELKLEKNDIIKEIWHGHYPGDYFPKLQVLEIIHFREQSALLSFFIQSLPNLEKLVVSEASFHEIFQCEQLSVEEKPAIASSQLSELKLSKLYELRHLWKEEFDPEPVFCNLRTLEVLECSRLNNLVPSIVSFKNLQSLEVSTCHGLINLVRYSTAKSLVQLKKMIITKCDLVEEIVACFEDDVNDGIVFTKLKCLQLCGLPRLASFCSMKCDFDFPSLEEVIVEGCPRMKIVSAGEVRTSKLQRVQFSEDKGLWENDLNTTIQQLFTEKLFSKGELSTPKLQKVKFIEENDEGRWEGNLNTTLQQMFIEKDSQKIAKHVQKVSEFNLRTSYPTIPQRVVAAPVKYFQEFESRMDVLDEIMKALESPSIKIIGLHGMPGVGKTMLLKEVKRKAEQEKFDLVVMVSVTKKNPDCRKIQDDIAYGLGLKLPFGIGDPSVADPRVADQLRANILKEAKVLVILDDIWDKLDLEALGIPIEDQKKMNVETGSSSTEDQRMKCKILLSSRERDVLSDEMGAEEVFVVGVLRHREPWQMFRKIVGERAESDVLQKTAIEIVEECGGLPIAIGTLANALKSKSLPEWKNALQGMKRPSASNFNGIHAKVYTAIEVSYDHLGSEELKRTFLLSSLMGHNAAIEDLLKYGVGLGWFSQANTIEGARNEVITLLNNLKASSLLIDGSDIECFDVHDVIRDVAQSIAHRDRHGLFLTDDRLLTECSDEKALNDFKWVFLEYVNMNELPRELASPQLTFFHLSNKYPSLEIPANFFKGMQRLRVLDLTCMQMSSLPSSISLLKNLHTLCLDQGVLGDISIIGELKNLEVLSLLRSDIKMLPREIGQLTRLKLLDMRGCSKLKVIQPRVLAGMFGLEELYLGNSFDRWEHSEHENQQNASLAELKHLKKLTALEIRIHDAEMIPEDLSFEKLERYKIFIGDAWNKLDSSSESSRILKLQLEAPINFYSSLEHLLKKTEELHLEKLKGIKNILYELDREGFQELRCLYIQNAPDIQHIMDPAGLHSQLRKTSFCSLRIITVECCNQLKKLFSFSTARQLLQLQEIGVTDCRDVVEVVGKEGREDFGDIVEATDQMVKLGKLLSLRLQKLPKFISFCRENDTGSRHVPLFSEKVEFPYLEKLQLAWINITTIWPPSVTSYCIQNLTEILIEGCDNLEHLFSSSMATGLVKLRDLKINQCQNMREIIVTENVEGMEISFPVLDFLQIQNLQNLVRFYSGNCNIAVRSLKQLTIENCPKLKEFTVKSLRTDIATEIKPLFNEQLEAFNLESLELYRNIKIQQIWHNRVPEMSSLVGNLIRCVVVGCDSLKYLLTSSMVKSLENLRYLFVRNCKMMEEVIVTEEGFAEEVTTQKIFLPNLQYLVLDDLPKLTRFCSGNYIKFPCLEGLGITQCPLLKAFTSSPVIGDMVVSTEKAENTSTPPLFDAKVAVPVLETLTISKMEGLHKIWHNQLDTNSFCKLKRLIVTDCETLQSIFPFSMLERLQRLEKLLIRECDSLEVIFEAQGPVASYSQPLVASQPTLVETETKLVLPKLTELGLESLPKLKGFCHPIHFKCPSLKKLEVVGFQQLEIFALEFPSFQSTTTSNDQLETRVQLPLFWINKATFCNLEELKLEKIGSLKEIWRGQYAGHYFPRLKKLELILFSKQSVVPLFFFQSLPCSLEKLVVRYASFHEIFQCEGALTQLRELRLSNLHELMHLWKVKPDFQTIIYNLRALEVLECSKLTNLVPSIISLRNLQDLEVSRCHGLVSLMRYSTAKSLVQLTRVSISDCDIIEEIVACNDDEVKDSIVFSQLKYLQLKGLPKLATFCSVKCNFEFPSLEDIIVMDCPYMQCFSRGELVTPKLQKVKCIEENDEGRWEGNLNTTLRQMFKQMVGYYGLENLKISESEFLDEAILEIWNSRNPRELLPFRKLKYLEVSNYSNWRYLLTPSMALGLVNLEDLEVSNCATLEHVITGDGADGVFPKLNCIDLESCSNLTCFYEGSSMLKLPSLEEITVANCAAMVTFAYGFSRKQDIVSTADGGGSAERHDIPIQPFFSNQLEVFNLKYLELSGNINIQQIWHNRVPEMSSLVRNLVECTVEGCDNLKYLLTSSMVKSLENLNRLIVHNCKMMEEVIVTEEGFVEEETTQKISFPNLESLVLDDLPKLKRFCSGNYTTFPCLEGIIINRCPLLKAFTSSAVIGDTAVSTEKAENTSTLALFDAKVAVPVLENLEISDMVGFHKIWHNQLDAESFCKLKTLDVFGCETLESIFPFSIQERLQRLEKLLIMGCDSLEVIFEAPEPVASYSQPLVASQPTLVETETKLVLPELTELRLELLPKLKGFCHSIHISLRNLQTLEVSGCHGLISLMRYPTAESLVQVTRMSISECDMIEEIVACMDDEGKDDIVFNQLKYLQLKGLPELATFCSVECNFEFPSLEDIIVMDCPNMQFFSKGKLITPKLQKVKLTENDEGRWEGELNATLQQLTKGIDGSNEE